MRGQEDTIGLPRIRPLRNMNMNVQDHEYEYRIKNTISVVKCNNFRSLHHCVCRYVVTGTLSLINCQMHLQYMYRVIKTV